MVTVMKIIDLSHTIAKTTPVFPGSEKPQLATVASYVDFFEINVEKISNFR